MARILAYTSPARGHLYPIVPTLLELRDRGHDVAVHTLAGETAGLTALGLDARPLADAIEGRPLDDWRARTPLGGQKRTFAAWAERGMIELGDLRSAIELTRPDALLVDSNAWGAGAIAETWSGPSVRYQAFPLPVRASGVPPFGPGLAPMRGPLGRLRDGILGPMLSIPLQRDALPRLNAVRKRAGAPALTSLFDAYTGAVPLLYLSAEPFEYPRTGWPDNVHLVGPGLWEPAGGGLDPALDEWLQARGRPVVLVSVSSEFQDDGRLIGVALDALAASDVSVIATPGANDVSGLTVPENARIVPFAPHGALLVRAHAVVCHAGMGITQKSLAHGVPVCAVPFGRDQLEVARRVQVAQAGVRLSPRRLDPARLRDAVERTVAQREGAQRIARAFAAAGGATAAADVVEATLASRQPAPSATRSG